jgi:pyruvate, orthophosphate dikinase
MKSKDTYYKGKTYNEGDMMTLDGSTGEVFAGALKVVDPELSGDFGTLMSWADKYRTLGVRTNADTPHDAEVARKFGAEGIGLCRTEHMFFAEDRIKAVREMILADNLEGRKKHLQNCFLSKKKISLDYLELWKVFQ